MWRGKFWLKKNHFLVKMNVKNDHQQWDQQTQHLEIHIYGLVLTLNWLYTSPVTNKVDGKPKIYRSGFASFTMKEKNRKTLGILVITSYLFLKNKKLQIKEKHLIVQKNAQSDHQKWYQKPQHLERHIYRIVALSTDCIQQQWRTRLTENWQFTAAVWPPSLWKKNHQTPDIFVLTSYLCLEFIFCFYVTQFNVFFCIESDENKLWQ